MLKSLPFYSDMLNVATLIMTAMHNHYTHVVEQ